MEAIVVDEAEYNTKIAKSKLDKLERLTAKLKEVGSKAERKKISKKIEKIEKKKNYLEKIAKHDDKNGEEVLQYIESYNDHISIPLEISQAQKSSFLGLLDAYLPKEGKHSKLRYSLMNRSCLQMLEFVEQAEIKKANDLRKSLLADGNFNIRVLGHRAIAKDYFGYGKTALWLVTTVIFGSDYGNYFKPTPANSDSLVAQSTDIVDQVSLAHL